MDRCKKSTIDIFGSSTEVLVPDCCGIDAPRSRLAISGVPLKKRWVDMAQAPVVAVSEKVEDWRTTPQGSAPPRYIVSVYGDCAIDRTQSLFAIVTAGIAWDGFEGAIEDIKKIGTFLRLVINPANLSGRYQCR